MNGDLAEEHARAVGAIEELDIPNALETDVEIIQREFGRSRVRAISLIDRIRHFADYLSAHSWLKGEALEGLHDMCRSLFEGCLPTLDSTDPALRLMSEFPDMKCL